MRIVLLSDCEFAGGAAMAANEFFNTYDYEFIYFALQKHMHCDVALRRI